MGKGMADAAYTAKYLGIARMLWNASGGSPENIPESYCEHLNHEYVDGDISLVSLLSKFDYTEGLEDYEIEEAVEMLGKVTPGDWPDIEDIEGVSIEELLRVYNDNSSEFNFVEDNLSTADKVEQVLIEVISSVFGDKVSTIRSEKGYYGNPKNNFLQEEDGTFAGTFMYGDNKFIFEVAPAEDGWLCTYRMHWDSVDKLPPKLNEDNKDKNDYTRRVRHRGWK
jgi:hypothetical protein